MVGGISSHRTIEYKFMYKVIKVLLAKRVLLMTVTFLFLSLSSQAQDYYVSNSGSDSNNGFSTQTAFKSLAKINALSLKPGDNIYLAAGQVFAGTIKIANEAGTSQSPITISNYGETSFRAKIDAKNELAGIDIVNASYLNISNIEIYANGGIAKEYRTGDKMRLGILVDVNDNSGAEYGHITYDNIYIHEYDSIN